MQLPAFRVHVRLTATVVETVACPGAAPAELWLKATPNWTNITEAKLRVIPPLLVSPLAVRYTLRT